MSDFTKSKRTPVPSTELIFHKYIATVLNVKNTKECGTHNSMVIKAITDDVGFPLNSTPHNNASLRITTDPVLETRPTALETRPITRAVQDVFFVVNMYSAKTDQQKEAKDKDLARYIKTTSGSSKNGTRDNRSWVRFNDHERYYRIDAVSLDQQLAKVYPASEIPTDVDRAFAVGFKHERIDLSNISAVVQNTVADNCSFQTSICHYSGQILDKQLRREGHRPIRIIGNRVFCEKGSSSHGLQEYIGEQGYIAYDTESKVDLVREKCITHFFQPIRVSEFFEEFFGLIVAINADEDTLNRMSSILKGVQVIVSFNGIEPNKTCQIFGVGGSTERDGAWLQVFGEPASFLKYPNMPLLNIGSKEDPVFHPAELCKIVGTDQIFRGKVPSILTDQIFAEPTLMKDVHIPKGGDPYPKLLSKGFNLTFVNLVEEMNDKSIITAVNNDVMESFKEQIGKRYNCSLEQSAMALKTVEVTPKAFGDRLVEYIKPGVKSAVIVVTPHGFSSSGIDKLRIVCDTRLGAQCHIVPGRDIAKRFHPVHTLGMKLITGGIVQHIFARAKIIKGGDNLSSAAEPALDGQLYGIHIHEQKTPGDFLIDMITISGPKAQEVRVSSHVFRAIGCKALANRLSCFIKDAVLGLPDSLAIYIRGIKEEQNEDLLQFLLSEIEHWFMTRDSTMVGNVITLTSVLPGPSILMANKNDTILLDQDFGGVVQRMNSREITIHEEESDTLTSRVFNVLPQYNTIRSTHNPLSVTYLRSEMGGMNQDDPKHNPLDRSSAVTLSTHKIPTILYLAGEASKRSRLRIRQKTPDELKAEQDKLTAHELAVKEAELKISIDNILKPNPATTGDVVAKKAHVQKFKEIRERFAKKAPRPLCGVELKPLRSELKNTFYFL